jgi:hypothetical protein
MKKITKFNYLTVPIATYIGVLLNFNAEIKDCSIAGPKSFSDMAGFESKAPGNYEFFHRLSFRLNLFNSILSITVRGVIVQFSKQ